MKKNKHLNKFRNQSSVHVPKKLEWAWNLWGNPLSKAPMYMSMEEPTFGWAGVSTQKVNQSVADAAARFNKEIIHYLLVHSWDSWSMMSCAGSLSTCSQCKVLYWWDLWTNWRLKSPMNKHCQNLFFMSLFQGVIQSWWRGCETDMGV